ncbi:MAG TPA: NADPH-dependent FMN reductase [Cytophagales bacterium]|jgi:chromate reductase|nr:NADPH-dependent FMN reductase [Cytophagales bacterium]
MISIIVGTNRQDSISKQIANQYKRLLAERNEESAIIDLRELPDDFIFSALYHNTGKNAAFNKILDQLNQSEKFVFIVPEYNGSFPGVLKAFIDGMTYPSSFLNKKCALVGLSSGVQGAGLALSHLTDIFNYLGMHVLALKPKLARIEKNMEEGKIKDPLYLELLEDQVRQLISF